MVVLIVKVSFGPRANMLTRWHGPGSWFVVTDGQPVDIWSYSWEMPDAGL